VAEIERHGTGSSQLLRRVPFARILFPSISHGF
jgi:hypothetical protein